MVLGCTEKSAYVDVIEEAFAGKTCGLYKISVKTLSHPDFLSQEI